MEDGFPSGSAIKVLIWELHSSPVNDGITYHINWLAGFFPSTVLFLLNKWSVWLEKRCFFHCSRRGRGLFDALPLISKQNFDPLVATFRPRKKPEAIFSRGIVCSAAKRTLGKDLDILHPRDMAASDTRSTLKFTKMCKQLCWQFMEIWLGKISGCFHPKKTVICYISTRGRGKHLQSATGDFCKGMTRPG